MIKGVNIAHESGIQAFIEQLISRIQSVLPEVSEQDILDTLRAHGLTLEQIAARVESGEIVLKDGAIVLAIALVPELETALEEVN